MCQVHLGHDEAVEPLLQMVQPQWAPYRRWGQTSSASDDLQQELWVTLWKTLQDQVPQVLQATCPVNPQRPSKK